MYPPCFGSFLSVSLRGRGYGTHTRAILYTKRNILTTLFCTGEEKFGRGAVGTVSDARSMEAVAGSRGTEYDQVLQSHAEGRCLCVIK